MIFKEATDVKMVIRKDRCKECGLCAASCPKQVISFENYVNKIGYHPVKVDEAGCIQCGSCYIVCPDGVYQFLGGDE